MYIKCTKFHYNSACQFNLLIKTVDFYSAVRANLIFLKPVKIYNPTKMFRHKPLNNY